MAVMTDVHVYTFLRVIPSLYTAGHSVLGPNAEPVALEI